MRLISRNDAKKQGLKRYFTGEPCKRGHVCERNVASSACLKCNLIAKAAYLLKSHETVLEYRKVYRRTNRDRMREKSREYHRANRARCIASRREWEKNNPEKRAAWKAKNRDKIRLWARRHFEANRAKKLAALERWREANPERMKLIMKVHGQNHRARKKAAPGSHTPDDIRAIAKAQGNRCAYCRISLKRKAPQIDHIEPLSRGGSNDRRNLQLTCRPCNSSKRAKDPIVFAQERGMLL